MQKVDDNFIVRLSEGEFHKHYAGAAPAKAKVRGSADVKNGRVTTSGLFVWADFQRREYHATVAVESIERPYQACWRVL